MPTFYTISDGKGSFVSNINIKISGTSGGQMKMSFFDKFDHQRHCPLVYLSLSEADRIMGFLNHFYTDLVEGFEVVGVTVLVPTNNGTMVDTDIDGAFKKDKNDKIVRLYRIDKVERPKGLTDDEVGKPVTTNKRSRR